MELNISKSITAIWKDFSKKVYFENGAPVKVIKNGIDVTEIEINGISEEKEYIDFLNCMIDQNSKLISFEICKTNEKDIQI